jgi:hypothetical protein
VELSIVMLELDGGLVGISAMLNLFCASDGSLLNSKSD